MSESEPLMEGRSPLLVTGYLRSGTTLLEKLLHAHDQVSVGAQPAPLLFVRLKELFLEERGLEAAEYPLNHLFLEDRYRKEEFELFLRERTVTVRELLAVLERLKPYSGWKTPALERHWSRLRPGPLIDLLRQLTSILSELHRKPGASVRGAKEVLCEEFIPYLLRAGAKVVLVVRDVRDVIASLTSGRSAEFVGRSVPTLYAIRRWRMSVAFGLAHEHQERFLLVRYEDLVRRFSPTLLRLTGFLGLPPFQEDAFEQGIFDQSGALWKGNSSFGEFKVVDDRSIGSYQRVLPEECLRFVELLAGPELRALGYLPRANPDPDQVARIAATFNEPVPCTREQFTPDYSTDSVRVEQERARLEALVSGLPTHAIPAWFVYDAAYERLREACRG
ncbi:MAG: sulfotransferase [Planctomycetota bacterium]